MVFVNYDKKEINLKVVLCGPVGGGKADVARFIYDSSPPTERNKMIRLATEGDETVFFDIPVPFSVRGFTMRVHVYTVPPQLFYESSRDKILLGADALILVIDSGLSHTSNNESFFHTLQGWLKEKRYTEKEPGREYTLEDIAIMVLCNMSTGGDGLNPERIRERLGISSAFIFEYSVEQRQGALDCLDATVKELSFDLTTTDEKQMTARQNARSHIVDMLGA